jgi:hypothetical protein
MGACIGWASEFGAVPPTYRHAYLRRLCHPVRPRDLPWVPFGPPGNILQPNEGHLQEMLDAAD